MSGRDRGSGGARSTAALAVGTTISGCLPVFLIGALFAQLQSDLGAPAWVLGVAVAFYWAVAAVVSVLSGRIISRIGSRMATIFSISGAVASLLGSAFLAPGWIAFVLWAGLGGAANSLGHPASNHLMSLRVPASKLATAFGIKQAAVPFAAFLAGLAVPVVALTLGWRWGFGLAAAVGVMLLTTFLLWGPRRAPGAVRQRRPHVPLPSPLLRYLLLMATATTLGAAAAGAASSFVVTAGIERGITDASAGILLSAGSLLGAVIRALAGRVADRTGGRIALPLTAALLASGAVGTALLTVDATWTFALGAVLALGPGWGWTGLTHYVVSRVSGAATPSATGLVQTGSYIGSGGGPLAF
ncbi:MAG: MFS transporter, partial [Actinobacteria bacterium]|nr:MFS transporter [Actinomycetota bacterium]